MKHWLLMSNCQAFGLATCMRQLNPGLNVHSVDAAEYRRRQAEYDASFGHYERLIVAHEVEHMPGADFSRAHHLSRLPQVAFGAYHPDLTYLFADGAIVPGPIGAYHSLLAFVAHGLGFGIDDTLALYRGEMFEAFGYFDHWAGERDAVVAVFAKYDYDVSAAIRRWGRREAFMYSTNHPRIGVMYDIARIYLEAEGYDAVAGGVLPHDNLAHGSCFPVYPEVGEHLGVPGDYLFKAGGDDYRQIGLREFVTGSFAAFDALGGRPATVEAPREPARQRIAAVIGGRA